jgi:hypothetical protein
MSLVLRPPARFFRILTIPLFLRPILALSQRVVDVFAALPARHLGVPRQPAIREDDGGGNGFDVEQFVVAMHQALVDFVEVSFDQVLCTRPVHQQMAHVRC